MKTTILRITLTAILALSMIGAAGCASGSDKIRFDAPKTADDQVKQDSWRKALANLANQGDVNYVSVTYADAGSASGWYIHLRVSTSNLDRAKDLAKSFYYAAPSGYKVNGVFVNWEGEQYFYPEKEK